METNGNKWKQIQREKREKSSNDFNCICGKSYKHDSNYYRHKKRAHLLRKRKSETQYKGI